MLGEVGREGVLAAGLQVWNCAQTSVGPFPHQIFGASKSGVCLQGLHDKRIFTRPFPSQYA
jgi:hypothetical protein